MCAACRQQSPAPAPAPAPAPEPAPPDLGPPNVVIFLIDTVRADHVSAYGYRRETWPNFDRFAADNVLFANAYAPSPWTRPSVTSIFTGAYPQTHDVQKRQDVLADDFDTLAEVLRARGYATAMLNTNPHITEAFNLPQGFERIVEVMPNPDELKDGNRADVVARHLDQLAPTLVEPFFLYVHVIDPHYPYDPPREHLEALGIKAQRPNSLTRYDGELRAVDHHINTMMELLERHGRWQRTIAVVTSDHGDEFHDHDNIGHGKTLYQEVVKVPMALRLPTSLRGGLGPTEEGAGYPRPRIEHNVSLVDLMPTLLELLEIEAPTDLDGESLVPLLRGEDPPRLARRPLYFSVAKERASQAGVLIGQTKLIFDRSSKRRELYRLDLDPREQTPDPRGDAALRELRQELERLLRAFEASIEPGLHLELASEDDREDSQRLLVTLETDGRFVDVEAHGFEESDHFDLSQGGKTLVVDARQVAVLHQSPKTMHVQDRDALSFDLEPATAKLSVMVERDGNRPGLSIMRTPRVRYGEWPIALTRAELFERTGRALVDRRKSGIYLYARAERSRQQAGPLSTDLTEALKSLGYLQ